MISVVCFFNVRDSAPYIATTARAGVVAIRESLASMGRSHVRCAPLRCANKKASCVLLAQRSDAHRGVRVNGPLEAVMVKLSIPARARVLHRQKICRTRGKAKPVDIPPAVPLTACELLLIVQWTCLPASSTSLAFLVVPRRLPSTECRANPILRTGPTLGPRKWLPCKHPSKNRKK